MPADVEGSGGAEDEDEGNHRGMVETSRSVERCLARGSDAGNECGTAGDGDDADGFEASHAWRVEWSTGQAEACAAGCSGAVAVLVNGQTIVSGSGCERGYESERRGEAARDAGTVRLSGDCTQAYKVLRTPARAPSQFLEVDDISRSSSALSHRSLAHCWHTMASRVLSRASTLENKLDSLSIHDEVPSEPLKRTSVAHKPANPKVRLPASLVLGSPLADSQTHTQLAPIRPSNAAAPSSTLAAQPTPSAPSSSNINRQPSLKLATANSAAARASNATGGKLRVPNGPGAVAGGAGPGLQSKFRGGGANSGATSATAGPSAASSSSSARPAPNGASARPTQLPASSSPPPSDVPSDIGTYDGGFERDEQRRETEREGAGGGQAIKGEAVKVLAMDSSAAGP